MPRAAVRKPTIFTSQSTCPGSAPNLYHVFGVGNLCCMSGHTPQIFPFIGTYCGRPAYTCPRPCPTGMETKTDLGSDGSSRICGFTNPLYDFLFPQAHARNVSLFQAEVNAAVVLGLIVGRQ